MFRLFMGDQIRWFLFGFSVGNLFCSLSVLEPLVLMAEHEFYRRPMQHNYSSGLVPDTSDERNDFIPHWAAGGVLAVVWAAFFC